jgi:hypothetical protein
MRLEPLLYCLYNCSHTVGKTFISRSVEVSFLRDVLQSLQRLIGFLRVFGTIVTELLNRLLTLFLPYSPRF